MTELKYHNGCFTFWPKVKYFNHYPLEVCSNCVGTEISSFTKLYGFILISPMFKKVGF